MIPFDRNTMRYWFDDGDNAYDIAPGDIPENTIVTDITIKYCPKQFIKINDHFELYE